MSNQRGNARTCGSFCLISCTPLANKTSRACCFERLKGRLSIYLLSNGVRQWLNGIVSIFFSFKLENTGLATSHSFHSFVHQSFCDR